MEVWQISHVSITYHRWKYVKIRVPRGLADAAKCTNPRPHWRVGSLVPSKLTELTVTCLTCGHYWKVVSNIFYFHPYLGKIPILTHIFQRGWNHQEDHSCTIFGTEKLWFIHGRFWFCFHQFRLRSIGNIEEAASQWPSWSSHGPRGAREQRRNPWRVSHSDINVVRSIC